MARPLSPKHSSNHTRHVQGLAAEHGENVPLKAFGIWPLLAPINLVIRGFIRSRNSPTKHILSTYASSVVLN